VLVVDDPVAGERRRAFVDRTCEVHIAPFRRKSCRLVVR
jgi:hypothetical protein